MIIHKYVKKTVVSLQVYTFKYSVCILRNVKIIRRLSWRLLDSAYPINIFDAPSTRLCKCHKFESARRNLFRTEGSLLEDARRKGRWLSDFLSVRTPYVFSRSSKREREASSRRGGGERVRAIKARPNKYKR